MTIGGVQTAPDHFLGDYPSLKWRRFAHAIPADLTGRTVLDIGCNAGFYSLEMKRRGADRVVGIDWDEAYLAQARFAAEANGAEIEFRQMSVYDVAALGEQFDVVLFMGVLYHLRHPLLALDLLYEHVVGDLLVFQSMLRGSAEVAEVAPDYPFAEQAVFDDPAFPRMHFIERQVFGRPDELVGAEPERDGGDAAQRRVRHHRPSRAGGLHLPPRAGARSRRCGVPGGRRTVAWLKR